MWHLLRCLLLALILPLAAHGQSASTGSESALSLSKGQAYPSKPIRVIIPFPPGNTMDIKEKLVAAGLIIMTEPPEFFVQTIGNDYEKYGKLIRTIGFKPQ